jgi:hypothetical protein
LKGYFVIEDFTQFPLDRRIFWNKLTQSRSTVLICEIDLLVMHDAALKKRYNVSLKALIEKVQRALD